MKAFWLCELSCDATFIVKFPRFVFSQNRLKTFPRLLLLLNLMLRTAWHWSVAMQKKNFAVKSKSISTGDTGGDMQSCIGVWKAMKGWTQQSLLPAYFGIWCVMIISVLWVKRPLVGFPLNWDPSIRLKKVENRQSGPWKHDPVKSCGISSLGENERVRSEQIKWNV